MKSKIIAVGGLLLAFAGSSIAAVLGGWSGIRPEITAPAVTESEALQSTIDFNKMVADRPGFLGEKVVLVQARADQAKTALSEAEAFKTAGPTKGTVNTAYYQFVSEHPGFLGEKIVLIQARKAEADKVLAGQ